MHKLTTGALKSLLIFSVIICLFSCTIVKHNKSENNDDEVTFYFEDKDFNAAAFILENWDSKIIPEIEMNSIPLSSLLNELRTNREKAIRNYGVKKGGSDSYKFMVKGPAIIKMIDRSSSAGILILEEMDLTGIGNCAIQIGPVIKKSAIRDSLSFINFGDFANQIEFANVSREINFYIRDNIVNSIKENYNPGAEVDLLGVFTLDNSGTITITPVFIKLTDGDSP